MGVLFLRVPLFIGFEGKPTRNTTHFGGGGGAKKRTHPYPTCYSKSDSSQQPSRLPFPVVLSITFGLRIGGVGDACPLGATPRQPPPPPPPRGWIPWIRRTQGLRLPTNERVGWQEETSVPQTQGQVSNSNIPGLLSVIPCSHPDLAFAPRTRLSLGSIQPRF